MQLRRVLLIVAVMSLAGCKSYPHVTPTQLGWLHSDGKVIRDQYGRQWIGHGVNARVSGLFDVTFTDGRLPLETIPDFEQTDVQQMAADGFNMLRLPINWSGLQPIQGPMVQSYLSRIAQVVSWCGDAGIYVLIDFHQDAYSKEIGEDGEPLWAIAPPPTMLVGGPLTDLTTLRESSQVLDASTSFFADLQSLQESFQVPWQAVAQQFFNNPVVLGYEPMNEPVTLQIPNDQGETELQTFYDKMELALRVVDTQHILWLEPSATRNLTLSAPLRTSPVAGGNVVYEPHMYPSLITVTSNTESAWADALEQSFDSILTEAHSYGAASFLGEWGVDPSDSTQFPYIQAVHDLLQERNMGEAFWLWKEESQANWGFFDLQSDGTWTVRASGLKEVARPYPLSVPGNLDSFNFDETTSVLTVNFTASGDEAAPLVYLNPDWYPRGVKATLNGKAISLATGRILLPWSGQSGAFTFVAGQP